MADKPFTAQADGRSWTEGGANLFVLLLLVVCASFYDHLIRLAHADALAIHLPQPGCCEATGEVVNSPRWGEELTRTEPTGETDFGLSVRQHLCESLGTGRARKQTGACKACHALFAI